MSCVQSVEQAQITIGATATSARYALTKGQVQAQCAPMFVSAQHDNSTGASPAQARYNLFSVQIIDVSGTPNIEIVRNAQEGNHTIDVTVYCVEFIDDIDIEEVSWTATSSDTINSTISAVTLANAFVVGGGSSSSSTANDDDHCYRLRLSTTTNVEYARYSTGFATGSGFAYVIHDTTGTHFNVQHILRTNLGGSPESTTIPVAVTLSRTILLATHQSNNSSHSNIYPGLRHQFNSTTVIHTDRSSTSSSIGNLIAFQVIEFEDTDTLVDRGIFTLATTTSTSNEALSRTYGPQSACHLPGSQHYYGGGYVSGWTSTAHWPSGKVRATLDATPDGVDMSRIEDSTSSTWYFSWEAIDFGDAPSSGRRVNIT